jgi:hypothetical protein
VTADDVDAIVTSARVGAGAINSARFTSIA